MTLLNQSQSIIKAKRSYTMLNFVYDIDCRKK